MANIKISNLASQAHEELAKVCEHRQDHEMRNNEIYGEDIEASLPTEMEVAAYEHKPLHARSPNGPIPGAHAGGMHMQTASTGGGHGTMGQFAKRSGTKPPMKSGGKKAMKY